MDSIKFSILIANYNNACYLPDALESVFAQTYSNWEVVIVDDASTDDSKTIYDKYSDDTRFHIVYNEKNMKCGYTKDRCVREASGELCGFLDPDDKLAPDALISMVEAFNAHPEIVMAYSNQYRTDEKLNIKSSFNSCALKKGESLLSKKGWPISHFVAFKRDAYLKSDGIDPIMPRCVDYDMYYKLEEMGPILYVDKTLYYYRMNSHSISLGEYQANAAAWHTYACINAMKRRGLRDESLMMFPIVGIQFVAQNEIRNTVSFRLGSLLLKPFRWIKRITNKS